MRQNQIMMNEMKQHMEAKVLTVTAGAYRSGSCSHLYIVL